jgi:mRNA-decapping enzyme subunit 2
MAEPTDEIVARAYEDALDDVHTRFVLNLPPEEMATSDRIFFQLEQAYWFYDDFICDNSDLPLPRYKSLRPFALKMFQISPLLSIKTFDKKWDEFSAYKRQISTYGAILLNEACTQFILCQVWNSKSWTFPAGKVNQNEVGSIAGARETYEETGFDPNCSLGLTKKMLESGEPMAFSSLKEEDALVFLDGGKRRTMYVCRGVPEDFPFAPVARKEVSAVEWHDIEDVPKKSFAVFPFLKGLKRWIKKDRKSRKQGTPGQKRPASTKKGRGNNNSRGRNGSRGRNDSRGRVSEHDPLTECGLAAAGEDSGWTENDMFQANEKLIGRKVTYDGNPHLFAEKGFDGGPDPHAFRVVGGSFLNSGGVSSLAPPPDQSKLQPLFRKDSNEDGGNDELQPFFSEGGETPWGEVITKAGGSTPMRLSRAEVELIPETKGGKNKPKSRSKKSQGQADVKPILVASNDLDIAFLTDAEVTARSQIEKGQETESFVTETKVVGGSNKHVQNQRAIQDWVKSLDRGRKNERFGDFRFNVNDIMGAATMAME